MAFSTEERSLIAKKGWTPERREKHRLTFNPYLGGGRPKGSKNKRPYPQQAREYKSIQTKAYLETHDHAWTGKNHSAETKKKQSQSRQQFFADGGRVMGSYKGLFAPINPKKYQGDPKKIVFRSLWERKFFKYCDTHTSVLSWASEEFSIPYISPVDGQPHRYFPDVYMKVKTPNGVKEYVVEIKPKYQTDVPKVPKRKTRRYLTEVATFAVNNAKWDAAREFCALRNWTFLILTEDHLFGSLNGR